MVVRKNINQKFAFISVYDKSDLDYLCSNLSKFNYNFVSTGATSKEIIKLGYKCLGLSKLTGFKEILDGRVKTLHPKVYGSILHKKDSLEHKREFRKLNFPDIDIVVVNLYPFKKYSIIKDENLAINMIDIGGNSLLRASSKNYRYVTTITQINDYKKLIQNLRKNQGLTTLNFRRLLATKTFKLTSEYDHYIYRYFKNDKNFLNKTKLRYGENPHQKASIENNNKISISKYQLNGKEISYNNIIDIDSGYNCLIEFKEPTCVIIKHTNPCAVASAKNIQQAFLRALESDKKSSFGGIVLVNRAINSKLANIINKNFFEILVSPKFDKKAENILIKKEKLILIKLDKINRKKEEFRSTIFGKLIQVNDNFDINHKFINLVSKKEASKKSIDDLVFSLKVAKHLKSNAIVLASNKKTIGLGMGQTNRIDALKIALDKMKANNKSKNYVCVSDGFFPFADGISLLKKNNCKIVAQPFGSINDIKIIKFAIKNKISLYFTKKRLFRH